jgi:hypothetical protein
MIDAIVAAVVAPQPEVEGEAPRSVLTAAHRLARRVAEVLLLGTIAGAVLSMLVLAPWPFGFFPVVSVVGLYLILRALEQTA